MQLVIVTFEAAELPALVGQLADLLRNATLPLKIAEPAPVPAPIKRPRGRLSAAAVLDAMQAAMKRGATDEQVQCTLREFGVARVRDVPVGMRRKAVAAFNSLSCV
jgi:hypothetical protein